MKFGIICGIILAFATQAQAGEHKMRKPAAKICSDTAKVVKAAEAAFHASEEPHGDNAQYKMTTAKFDRWEVDMNYHDSCYRTVTVFMKPGTCTEAKDPVKGHETCTDD
ncbi:MAG: hypothetical protein ACXVB9_09815 [Bdellovibrionota bacterium]